MTELLTKFLERLVGIEEAMTKKADSAVVDELGVRVSECEKTLEGAMVKLTTVCSGCEEALKGKEGDTDLVSRVDKIEALFGSDGLEKVMEKVRKSVSRSVRRSRVKGSKKKSKNERTVP